MAADGFSGSSCTTNGRGAHVVGRAAEGSTRHAGSVRNLTLLKVSPVQGRMSRKVPYGNSIYQLSSR